jgi:hypothetical protein
LTCPGNITGIHKKRWSHTKTENSPITGEDMETSKNTSGMVRRYLMPNIQKRG